METATVAIWLPKKRPRSYKILRRRRRKMRLRFAHRARIASSPGVTIPRKRRRRRHHHRRYRARQSSAPLARLSRNDAVGAQVFNLCGQQQSLLLNLGAHLAASTERCATFSAARIAAGPHGLQIRAPSG
jgi:hypothetical protein